MPRGSFSVQDRMDFDNVTLDLEIDHIRELFHERSLIAASHDLKHFWKLTDRLKARIHAL